MMKRGNWTAAELRLLRKIYPRKPTTKVAAEMGRSVSSVNNQAFLHGLHKTAAYLKSPESGRLQHRDTRGLKARFKKGIVPWNKGMKGWTAGGRSAETRFKRGNKPWTWQPIGAERVTKDGLLQRKITDTGYPPRDWKAVHALVWMKHHGRKRVPRGHLVVFRDRDNRNFDPANLECITRAENMRRNTYHRYPKEIARLIQLQGALTRQINKRERHAEQH